MVKHINELVNRQRLGYTLNPTGRPTEVPLQINVKCPFNRL